jgi:cytochrome P450
MFEVQRGPLALLQKGFREYGDIVGYRFGNLRACLIAHPGHIQHVLHDNHRNYDKNNFDYAMLRRLLGNGLLTSDGAFWRRQRRLMAPMFLRQRVAAFCPLVVENTVAMVERWQDLAASAQPFDLAAEMARLALAIVTQALFSIDVSAEASAIGRALMEANQQLSQFSFMDLIPLIPTARKRRFRDALSTLDGVVGKMIAGRRRAAHREPDLLSMLLDAREDGTGASMSERQVRDEVLTLMLAGHETTANALSWTFYLLSRHPEAETRLRNELAVVLGGRTPTADDLPHLCFTRMVIEESMRLYPPAWVISRNAIADDEIGGYRVRRGTTVMMCSFITHRHRAFWPDPEHFDPERFTAARCGERPAYSYFPFGGGPRVCIGNNFAMTEAQLILATIAQRYRLRLVPGHPVELQPLVTLRARHGMRVSAHRVDHAAASRNIDGASH